MLHLVGLTAASVRGPNHVGRSASVGDPGPPNLSKPFCRLVTALPVEPRSRWVSGPRGIRCQVLSPTTPSAGRLHFPERRRQRSGQGPEHAVDLVEAERLIITKMV